MNWPALVGLLASLGFYAQLVSWVRSITLYERLSLEAARTGVYLIGPCRESLVVWAEYDDAVQADVAARMLGSTRPVDAYLKLEVAAVNAWHSFPPGQPWPDPREPRWR